MNTPTHLVISTSGAADPVVSVFHSRRLHTASSSCWCSSTPPSVFAVSVVSLTSTSLRLVCYCGLRLARCYLHVNGGHSMCCCLKCVLLFISHQRQERLRISIGFQVAHSALLHPKQWSIMNGNIYFINKTTCLNTTFFFSLDKHFHSPGQWHQWHLLLCFCRQEVVLIQVEFGDFMKSQQHNYCVCVVGSCWSVLRDLCVLPSLCCRTERASTSGNTHTPYSVNTHFLEITICSLFGSVFDSDWLLSSWWDTPTPQSMMKKTIVSTLNLLSTTTVTDSS